MMVTDLLFKNHRVAWHATLIHQIIANGLRFRHYLVSPLTSGSDDFSFLPCFFHDATALSIRPRSNGVGLPPLQAGAMNNDVIIYAPPREHTVERGVDEQ